MLYEKNIDVLKRNYPDIYDIICSSEKSGCDCEVIYTKTSLPTLRLKVPGRQLFLHSCIDPLKEAAAFARSNYDSRYSTYIIYGFGLYYHIKAFMNISSKLNIYVFESNVDVFKAALSVIDLREEFEKCNLHIILENKPDKMALELKHTLSIPNCTLIIHLPSLQAMSDGFAEIRDLLEEYRVSERSINNSETLLEENFSGNIQSYDLNIDSLFGKFTGIPAVIVSSGPSLDKNKLILKDLKNKAIILSVGRSLKPLLVEGICPDMVIVTDPHDIVYNQLEDLDIEIPVIGLATCCHKVFNNSRGIKFIALQEGFLQAETYAKQNCNKLVRTGGSVATTALDIIIRFGCNPIIFVGQDLAFSDGRNYVRGTLNCTENILDKNLRPVKGVNGETVYTTKSLAIFKRWIENRIAEEKDILFINATEGGSDIEGTVPFTLQYVASNIVNDRQYSMDNVLNEAVKNHGR